MSTRTVLLTPMAELVRMVRLQEVFMGSKAMLRCWNPDGSQQKEILEQVPGEFSISPAMARFMAEQLIKAADWCEAPDHEPADMLPGWLRGPGIPKP